MTATMRIEMTEIVHSVVLIFVTYPSIGVTNRETRHAPGAMQRPAGAPVRFDA